MIRRLVIAAPCADSKFHVPWVQASYPLGQMLSSQGIEWVVESDSSGWTAAARNRICARALSHWKADAVLFIDNDILYKVSDVERLLAHADHDEVSVIGAFYPRKKPDWIAGARAAPTLQTLPEEQFAKALQHAVMRGTHPHAEIGDRISMPTFGARVRCNLLPAGFMLVRRDGLETFVAKTGGIDGPWSYKSDYQENVHNAGMTCYGFFQHPIEDHVLFGEDIFFSTTCIKVGIPIWKLCDVELGHAGMMMF